MAIEDLEHFGHMMIDVSVEKKVKNKKYKNGKVFEISGRLI